MNYSYYEIIGKNKDTNRKRTIKIAAKSKDQAEQIAFNEYGLLPPLEIMELPHDLPTEAQIEYAKSLQIKIPLNATRKDVSALISRKEDNDKAADPSLIEFADNRNLFFSKYIGEKALIKLIFYNLSEIDRIAFYAFVNYLIVSKDNHKNLDTHPDKELFYQFANQVKDDIRFIKSLEENTQKDFYDNILNGRTVSYKQTAEFIKNTFGDFKD